MAEEEPAPRMVAAAVAFGRVLRGAGLSVGTERLVGFARALEELDVGRREDVYWAGRVTLTSRPEDVEVYDRAFEVFWERGAEGAPPRRREAELRIPEPEDSVMPAKETVEPDERGEEAVGLRYSPVEVLRKKDFALYSPEEFAELQRLLADLRLSGALRRTRRLEPARRGRHDPRRTMRSAMRTGGETVRHRFRRAKDQPRRVVLLCDVSGSMAPYSRALLRFLHAGVISGGRFEAFSVGTRLTRITRELSTRDPDRALRQAAGAVRDLSGGTRLGDALKEFVDRWGQRGMARGAVVVILSDGWDRGDVAVLAEQMRRIRRLAYRVIWVNPLKAAPGYRPLAAGMAAALPYVDVFLSGHNFESLEELARAVAAAAENGRR
ncbi:VWA domain-containing protein [Rubrobacter xylanophilus]|uniref:VWA domain-containing protein n=1 Tax=Rubrobacter xylanophilus TaxID=49319 RepID=A0A510HNY9_9ACTN|nr:VWA domain-containing protein [Rubrobacter xylanophilus]BBL80367.1 VWA domain-containing protein [Rubrobacter xylanophilus]